MEGHGTEVTGPSQSARSFYKHHGCGGTFLWIHKDAKFQCDMCFAVPDPATSGIGVAIHRSHDRFGCTGSWEQYGTSRKCAECGKWMSPDGPATEAPDLDNLPTDPDPTDPDHYKGEGMQVWEVIDAFGLDYYEGNVLKYLLRWRKKGGVEDLSKAQTYLDRIIDRETE